MYNCKKSLLCLLTILCLGSACRSADESEGQPAGVGYGKLVWAHYVAWGFNFADNIDDFDAGWRKLDDRSRLGSPWTSSNEGLTSTTRTQILSAMQYGIDGFTVNIIGSNAYASAMGRVYRAAEGLPFKVSLCVDNFGGHLSVDEVVDHMVAYFERWGTHPNNHYIDGKPVIFMYKAHRDPESCVEIIAKLKALGHEAYWLNQPQRENTLWDNRDLIDGYLSAFDGLYDFGSNGISLDDMKLRLENGRAALERAGHVDGGLLVAGITQGYNGSHNAFYRPFHGTGTLRNNWEAAIAADADWVCLTTWNDYIESTHFEPADWERGALLEINREYIRRWRGELAPPRPPQVFAAYKNEVRLGDEWTFELQSFPYTTSAQTCYVRVTDFEGNVVQEFDPMALDPNEQTILTHRLEQAGMETPRYLRVWTAISSGAEAPSAESDAWRELYPVVVRPGIMCDYRTIRVHLNELLPAVSLQVKTEGEGLQFKGSLDAWSWVGKAELLCNGRVIASEEIAKMKSPKVEVDFTFEKRPEVQPVDLYVLRMTRADGMLAWSRPVLVDSLALANQQESSQVEFPVMVRNGDFDEVWGRALNLSERVQKTVSESEIYGFHFPMDDQEALYPKDSGAWNISAVGGGRRWGFTVPEAVPAAVVNEEADSHEHYFKFDGVDDRIVLEVHSFPHDVVTVEAWVRPEAQTSAAYILSDQSRVFDFGIGADGKLFSQRGMSRAYTDEALPVEVWSHVAAVYDGVSMRFYVNGELAGETAFLSTVRSINSVPTIGCKHTEHLQFSHFYRGDMAGIAVTANVLKPSEFKLLK